MDTTSPVGGDEVVSAEPGNGDDDRGFDEGPDSVERDDGSDREER